MQRFVSLLFTLIALATVYHVPAIAQDSTETIALSGAFTVTIPSGWTATEYLTSGYFWETDSSEIRIRTYSPTFQQYYETENPAQLMEFLVTDVFETRGFDKDKIQEVQFGDHAGISYTYEELSEGKRFERAIFLYQIENGFIVAGYISPLSGQEIDATDIEELKTALATVTPENVFEFYEGTSFEIPVEWSLTEDINENVARSRLQNEDLIIDIKLWPGYGAIAGLEEPADFLAYIFNGSFGDIESFNRSRLQTTKVAGFDAVIYPFSVETLNTRNMYDRAVIAFTLSQNHSTFTVKVEARTPDAPLDPVFNVLDTFHPGSKMVCALFATPGIRIRQQPSTDSEIVRQTESKREVLVATRKAVDSFGYEWFDVGEGWIRSDVIYYEQNACANVPIKRW